jgi:Rad3-related DNA helicase
MKYEKQILAAFERLKFTPRAGQVEAVNEVLVAFIDEKMVNVILNASTGTGKSIIGAVTADTLSALKNNLEQSKSSISLTATNVLAKQYEGTFGGLKNDFIMIKGANNYECSALSTEEQTETADACAWYTMVQHASEFQSILDSECAKCEYKHIKDKRNAARHLATNYSYYFIDRMYTGKFEDRDLIVWDEAHLVNDLFSEHNAIHFSQKGIQKMAQEIADMVQITDMSIIKTLKQLSTDVGVKGKINDTNYQAYLKALHSVYTYAKTRGSVMQEKALRSGNHGQFTKLSRFTKKYEGLGCKIDDFEKYGYAHVFEYKEEDKAVTVKPVFVGTMMEALECAAHNLFMSATISEAFITKTMNLDPKRTKFIKLDPTFPKENKEVVFFDPLSLNFTSLKDPATVAKLRKNAAKIVKHHIQDGERGIILTPSFKLTEEIVQELEPLVKAGKMRLFDHRQGEKLEHVLTAFKAYTGGPAVLISPAMFEGVDLPGDLSRFQILVKAPFPSLGDKRMKFILDHHPDLYNTITCMKMVQGAGRSVRSAEDFATTYVLDLNAQRIFNSNTNIWKDEFNLRFTKFL